jgi:hypothetical protein
VLAAEVRLYRQQAALAREAMATSTAGVLPLGTFGDVRKYAEACNQSAAAVSSDLRGKLGNAKPVRETLNALTKFANDNLVATAKATIAMQNLPNSPPVQQESSPGVAVVAAAMASTARLRLTIHANHEVLELEIKHPKTTLSEVRTILNGYRVEDQVDLEYIRENYQLATEAMIWAALLLNNIDKDIMRNRREISQKQSPSPQGFFYSQDEHKPMKIADQKYLKYLLARFAAEVERWARGTKALTGTYRGFERPTWGKEQSDTEKEDLLVAYLAAVADGTPPWELKSR